MNQDSIEITRFVLGPWMTNCYVVAGPRDMCCIIDAGFDPGEMIRFVQKRHWEPQAVLLTHAHVDHIAGLAQCRVAWPQLPILIHPAERSFLTDPAGNLSSLLATPLVAPEATGILTPDSEIDVAGRSFTIRHTPGHSPGGVTLYDPRDGIALVGDTLFAGSIGRTDFPHADQAMLLASISKHLMVLPDATRVLSGHGSETTIETERRGNPFVR